MLALGFASLAAVVIGKTPVSNRRSPQSDMASYVGLDGGTGHALDVGGAAGDRDGVDGGDGD